MVEILFIYKNSISHKIIDAQDYAITTRLGEQEFSLT